MESNQSNSFCSDIDNNNSTMMSDISTPEKVCLPEPTFSVLHIQKGWITCQICFIGCEKKHAKRQKFEKLNDLKNFRQYAIRWKEVDHHYKDVHDRIEWPASGLKWAHRSCKSMFFNNKYLKLQQPLASPDIDSQEIGQDESFESDMREESLSPPLRKGSRKKYKYESSWKDEDKKKCIICNEDKRIKGRLVPIQIISIPDKAQETLTEYAKIHLENKHEKYMDGAKRILLTLSTASLLSADVAYHKRQCYEPFRSPAWKRQKTAITTHLRSQEEDGYMELFQLVLVHIINRKEVYTLAQLKGALDQIRGTNKSSTCRSIDLKEKLQHKFGAQLCFHKAHQGGQRSEFVYHAGVDFTADCVNVALLGGGISKSLALKNTARIIHMSINETKENQKWPPTPQDIIESDSPVNKDLYNELAWIVDPKGLLDDDGRVQLSRTKATKLVQIAQNLQTLLPNSCPSMDQTLLSLTMHRKTGSSGVIDTLHRFGYGISYTDTLFIQDKWAAWAEAQHSDIPSNIRKGIQTTHIADNIDWKNKDLGGKNETHNTNSILVQQKLHGQFSEERCKAQVSLTADYNFDRKCHASFKGQSSELHQYISQKADPIPVEYSEETSREESVRSTMETLAWVKCRIGSSGATTYDQSVPAWSGFKNLTTKKNPTGVNVGFLPAITSPPTQMNVILAIMNRTMHCMKELELDCIFLEVDQAIYTKVLQVLFNFQQEGSKLYDKLVVRMGGFHIILCMLKTIYSRFSGSGIVELLAEAGIGANGTIKAALNGSNVKQGIRYYKIIFEALMRTKLEYLEANNSEPNTTKENAESEQETTSDDHQNALAGGGKHGTSLEAAVARLRMQQTPDTLNSVLYHSELESLPSMIGGMATWMDSLIDMVDMLLNTIHFQRTGNWEGFLEAIDQFLPWCFALNRHNYARNMSYYYVDMRNLKSRNPNAYAHLKNGGFCGSLSGEKHTQIPMDQIIEMTINRLSKETGGLSGQTENVGTSERWMRMTHYLAALKHHLEVKIEKTIKPVHVELGKTRMEKDEAAVQRVVEGLHAWMPHIWSPTQPLVNMCTCEKASDEMVKNVTSAKERGVEAKKEFFGRITKVSEASLDLESQTDFMSSTHAESDIPAQATALKYTDPIKRQPVITFDKIKKKKKIITVEEDEGQSFAAILSDFDERTLDLHSLMHWPITSKPWAICNAKGVSRPSSKSLFRNNLELLSPVPPTCTSPTDIQCCIVDAMRVVRIIPIKSLSTSTYKSWADRIVNYLQALPGSILHLVFDDYSSPEGHLYLSKGRPDKGRERIISDLTQQLPNLSEWADFLTNDLNKFQLTKLLADYILSGESHLRKEVFVTKGHQCYFATWPHCSVSEVPELYSYHREADPRIISHAMFASSKYPTCVVADDTDVFILLLFVASKCERGLYFRQGTASSRTGITYHNIRALAGHLGENICSVLPAFHALTGSDYTQPFFGRSKFKCFQKMQKNPETSEKLKTLNNLDADQYEITDFILHVIYNRPITERTPGDSRYAMLFGKGKRKHAKRKFTTSRSLPPDEQSLKFHIHRANFVTNGMVNCLNGLYKQPDPLVYGWKVESEKLVPVWYEGEALPKDDIPRTTGTQQQDLQSHPPTIAESTDLSTDLFGFQSSDGSDTEDEEVYTPMSEPSSEEEDD